MKDTSRQTEKLLRDMMNKRSGSERIRMASDMFESARTMVCASLPNDLLPADFRQTLLQRTYPEILTNPR